MNKKIVKFYVDADILMRKGFRCLGVDRNIEDKAKLIFWFEDTYELRTELKNMIDDRRK